MENITNVRWWPVAVALTSVLVAGCGGGSSTGSNNNPVKGSDTKPKAEEVGYLLRNTKTPIVGTILRYEKYFDGKGSTLFKGPGKSISSEDESIERVITETEITVVQDGEARETKVRYHDDIDWHKRKEIGGETTSKYADGRFKGETLWGRHLPGGDWKYTLIGSDPTDAQRKRLKGMGRASPPQYPDYKVKPGDSWKINMRDYPEMLMKEGMDNVEGEMEFKFVKVVEFSHEKLALNKEICAEIKGTMKAKGTFCDGGEISFDLEQTGTIYRSLSKHLDVQEVNYRRMKYNGTISTGGVEVKVTATISGDETVLRTLK